ncbi:AbrB/MazE/SpoVT family DNA-binding domain-containing protein [Methylobacterium sp. J-026]|uniref:antitoxin n=1 Tax=Methylobacterium sp. J-026 TaxID=2836624 RepID=UPI001FB891AE|nr:AbrB/MazE/SpoVT family DNA-binding domain-containing protein [Methylobacterium sp. J-026]MCJ2134608.1 AbrB/MazE/SpoVT family DNA-binding domain-containing protein [Methylobacterium sp. J-026]
MTRTRVFQSGNSQAVRIPSEFRLQGPEVEISRRGEEIVLREVRDRDLSAAFALITELPLDDLVRGDEPAQDRETL